MTPNDSIATRGPQGVAVFDPGLDANDIQGTENFASDDVKLPFLAIAQKTSKAIDPTESKYIAGLKFGEIYNSETQEILGTGPVEFIPVKLSKRACLKTDKGTLGERVDWEDPRVTWDGANEAGLKKPEGVRIYDWAGILVPSMERVVISFQSTSFGAGKTLITMIDRHEKLARMAKKGFRPYQLKFTLSTAIDKNDFGSFGKFMVKLSTTPVLAEEFAFANSWFDSLKGKTIVTEDSQEVVIDAQVVSSAGSQNPPRGNDNIPF
jgi:hypothetical protein